MGEFRRARGEAAGRRPPAGPSGPRGQHVRSCADWNRYLRAYLTQTVADAALPSAQNKEDDSGALSTQSLVEDGADRMGRRAARERALAVRHSRRICKTEAEEGRCAQARWPCACSGDMSCQVPRMVPVCVAPVSASSSPAMARSTFASPKSTTFGPANHQYYVGQLQSRCADGPCGRRAGAPPTGAPGRTSGPRVRGLWRDAPPTSGLPDSSITITGCPANPSTP